MGKLGLLCVLVSIWGGAVFGQNLFLVDFDNTLVETRREFGGSFKTAYRLFRIDQRTTALQPTAKGPRYIDVNPIDYHRIERDLGTAQGKPGRFRKVTLEDGTTFIAGEYMLRNPDSFIFFGTDLEDDENYLLNDFKAAEERQERGEGHFQGEVWNIMRFLLSNKRTAEDFGIITARGHSEKHWAQFFRYLKNKKGQDGRAKPYISHLPNPKYIHNTSHPDYDQFDLRWDKAKQKMGVLEKTIRDLGRVALSSHDERLHPDGKQRARFHTLVYADDNQQGLEAAIDLFREFLWTGLYPIKFIVINTGNRSEIRETQRPQYAVMKMDGTFRAATALERLGEPEGMSEDQAERVLAGELSCDVQLASNAR